MLPNHYLFTLAERTPGDMASLLSVFHPVPPVIRRRAKELLDTIRDTIKKTLGTAGSAAPTSERSGNGDEGAMLVDDGAETTTTTDADAPAPAAQATVVQPSIWSSGESAANTYVVQGPERSCGHEQQRRSQRRHLVCSATVCNGLTATFPRCQLLALSVASSWEDELRYVVPFRMTEIPDLCSH